MDFKKSEFKLKSLENIFVVVQRGKKLSLTDVKFLELKDNFQDSNFSLTDVSKTLGISKASSERLLSKAFDEGRVIKDRKKQGMAYRLVPINQKKKAA